MNHRFLAVTLGSAALLAVSTPAHATPAENARYLNARYLNARYLNGIALNARYLNARYLNGPTLGGQAVEFAGVADGGWLVGDVNGVHTTALEGTLFSALSSADGGTDEVTTLRIDRIIDRGDDVPHYEVSVHNGYDWQLYSDCSEPEYGCWEYWYQVPHYDPVCPQYDETGAYLGNTAVAVDGMWEQRPGYDGGAKIYGSGAFTFACTEYAIGKCIDTLGYLPWEGDWVETTVWGWRWESYGWWSYLAYGRYPDWVREGDLHHQACTRLITADYCGDGIPRTETGTPIDVGDNYSPRVNTLGSPQWAFEAAWGPDGVLWMSDARIHSEPGVEIDRCTCPEFDAERQPYCDLTLPVDYIPFENYGWTEETLMNRSSTIPTGSMPL